MPSSVTTYSLAELKELFPDAFARVHKQWSDGIAESGDIAWKYETMDSLRAVINECGATLADWSIGAYSPSSITVKLPSDLDEMEADEARAWYLVNVLKPNGYVKSNGHADFPGHCKFTGYCADDDFLEAVWKRLNAGDDLKAALEGLADDVREHFEADMEQEQQEDSMFVNWSEDQFTKDGVRV